MAISIGYEPYAAIAGGARAAGFGEFLKEQELQAERRRNQELQMAMQAEQLRARQVQDAFNRDMAARNFQEGQRRFDTNLWADQANRQMADQSRQQALGAQLGARQADVASDLYGQQMDLAEQQLQGQQEAARQAALTQREMERAAMQLDGTLRNQLAASRIPDDIAEGISNGSLAYSPQQKSEMQQIQESINKARTDRTLTDAERIAFEAQQLDLYRQIRDNPLEVPPDERPVPLAQQFEQETTVIPGLPGRWQRSERNGLPQWEPVEMPEDQEAKAAAEQQKAQVKLDQDVAKFHTAQYKADLDRQQREYDVDVSVWKASAPDKKEFTSLDEDGNPVINSKGFSAALAEWKKQKPVFGGSVQSTTSLPVSQPTTPELTQSLPVNHPTTPEMEQQGSAPPQWYLDLPSGAPYTAPDGTKRIKP